MQGPDCSCCNRQHNSGLLHKQARGYEVRLSLCPPMETSVLVPSQRDSFEREAHSRSLECDSGQAFQAQSSGSNRVVSLSTGIQSLVFQMGPTAGGLLCDPVQSQTAPSPVPDPAAWAVDALSLPWEQLEGYAFPPVSLIPQVIAKLRDQGCRRMILVAPGWPNMPWFGDLVHLSVQIPFSLPLLRDLVTQPFNGFLHRNLSNLNLHPWLLESLPSENTVSLRRWQQELRLLRETRPEQCTSQSGPFLLNGVSHARWTSGRPL